jgi:hypothetical protein
VSSGTPSVLRKSSARPDTGGQRQTILGSLRVAAVGAAAVAVLVGDDSDTALLDVPLHEVHAARRLEHAEHFVEAADGKGVPRVIGMVGRASAIPA